MKYQWTRYIAILAFTGWAGAASALPMNGLVSYWDAEGNALDSGGVNSNDGTLNGNATYGVGQNGNGQAFLFDGAGDYVNTGSDASLTMTNAFTVSAWIMATGRGSASSAGGIVGNKEGEYEFARFADGSIRWAIADTGPTWFWRDTGVIAALNEWIHLSFVYDGAGGTLQTFAGGVLADTQAVSGSIGDVDSTLNEFWIGGRPCCSQFFAGSIDEVAIWNRALTAAEVNSVANQVPTPATLALFGIGLAGIFRSRRKA